MGDKLYQDDLRQAQDSELYGYDALYRLTSWERVHLIAVPEKEDRLTGRSESRIRRQLLSPFP